MFKIGHRGAPGYCSVTENTLVSFRQALDLGADILEMDIRRTKDNQLVVFHDERLERLTYQYGRVRDYDYESLRHVFVGPGQKIPLLSQVLNLFGHRTFLNLELKDSGIAGLVFDMVRRYNLAKSVIVSAFSKSEGCHESDASWQDLFWMKSMDRNLKIALVAESAEWTKNAINSLGSGLARDNPFPIYALCLDSSVINEETVNSVRSRSDAKIFSWTANDLKEIARLKSLGVDGIFSDHPNRL